MRVALLGSWVTQSGSDKDTPRGKDFWDHVRVRRIFHRQEGANKTWMVNVGVFTSQGGHTLMLEAYISKGPRNR